MNVLLKTAALATSLTFFAAAASAQDSGGVEIKGDVNISATGKGINTTSDGESIASTGVGVVRGNTEVKGDVNITASAKDVTTKAEGKSCAETTIGGVGSGPCGN